VVAGGPLLLLAQLLLVPAFLLLFLGPGAADAVTVGPFVQAFLRLIVLPWALAWATQAWVARPACPRGGHGRRPDRRPAASRR
jgi:membrane protein implicated in regulation of membrane protease activity